MSWLDAWKLLSAAELEAGECAMAGQGLLDTLVHLLELPPRLKLSRLHFMSFHKM